MTSEKKTIALWKMGFRPFFLGGSVYGLLFLGYWSAWLYGWGRNLGGQGNPIFFHVHEMLYGFVTAIVAGFLLTASANWTGTRGLHGRPLQILVGVWGLGRVGMGLAFFGGYTSLVWLSILFLPMLIAALFPALWKARKWPNLAVLFWLGLLAVGQALYLLEVSRIWGGWGRKGLFLGVYGIVFLMVMIGGRVIPYFSRNALQDPSIEKWVWMDRLGLGWAAVFVVASFVIADGPILGGMALLAGLTGLLRMRHWGSLSSRRVPILWILHLSYLWVMGGFLLYAGAAFGLLESFSIAIHAFTVGGMGGLILGMLSRVSLGHTGRPLELPSGMIAAYLCISLSALFRVCGPLLPASWLHLLLLASGLAWIAAYLIFLLRYTPILLFPRADGKEG